MSLARCARVWIVEAVRDGRVKGTERDAFERHLPTCPDCFEESRRLDELGQKLRLLPVDQPDVLAVRRQRQRLMSQSDSMRMKQARSPWPRRLGYALAIATGVGLTVGWGSWAQRDRRPMAEATSGPFIDVRPEPGARWRHTPNGDTNRVELDEGTISLRIRRSGAAGRIVIVVPDGEIEDFGTVLRISVEEGRTTAVRVDEGVVAIRVRGVPELRLGAGESWAPVVSKANDLSPPNVAQPSSVAEPATLAPRPRAPSKKSIEGSSHRTRADVPGASDAAKSSESHEAEDLAYLEVLKLAHEGKAVQARAQAREYLLRFPNGFRRVEMLDIATGQPENR